MAIRGISTPEPGQTSLRIGRGFDQSGVRTYRVYADPGDDEFAVADALPDGLQMGTAHPNRPAYVVMGLDISDRAACTFPGDGATPVREWAVTPTYGPWTNLLDSLDGNPLNQPARFRWQCSRVEVPVDLDVDGEPILNTAGLPFSPAPTRDGTAAVLIVTRNELNPNFPTIFGQWVDRVNEFAWNGFAPRTLKICPVNLPERLYSQRTGQLYYPMEYQFEYAPDNWDLRILNLSLVEKDPNASDRLRPIVIGGVPVSEPQLLNLDGHYLPPPVAKEDVLVYETEVYKTLDFGVLGLDNLFAANNTPPPSGG